MSAVSLAPGTRFKQYTITRVLGQGGMGVVYEAMHEALGRRVALKTLTDDAKSGEGFARFLREARAAAALRHPHVVDVFDVGVEQGVPFIAMEFLEGEDLASLLERTPVLPLERMASIVVPICSAVAAAHAAGIVHRDLKPANVFLAKGLGGEAHAKLLDFGISKVGDGALVEQHTGTARPLTATAALLGTVPYMAPEQARQSRLATAQSDQYALAVIVYECVCGTRPFIEYEEKGELFGLLSAIIEGRFVPPRVRNPSLPAWLEQVLVRAMKTDPAQRFASVNDFARALCAALASDERARWLRVFEGDGRLGPFDAGGAITMVPSLVPPTVQHAQPRGEDPARRAQVALLSMGVFALVAASAAAIVWSTQRAPATAIAPTTVATTTMPPSSLRTIVPAPPLLSSAPTIASTPTTLASATPSAGPHTQPSAAIARVIPRARALRPAAATRDANATAAPARAPHDHRPAEVD